MPHKLKETQGYMEGRHVYHVICTHTWNERNYDENLSKMIWACDLLSWFPWNVAIHLVTWGSKFLNSWYVIRFIGSGLWMQVEQFPFVSFRLNITYQIISISHVCYMIRFEVSFSHVHLCHDDNWSKVEKEIVQEQWQKIPNVEFINSVLANAFLEVGKQS